MTTEGLYSYNNGKYLWGSCFTRKPSFLCQSITCYVLANWMPLLLRSEKMKLILFMVKSFIACYFNYFHFYTILWNICGIPAESLAGNGTYLQNYEHPRISAARKKNSGIVFSWFCIVFSSFCIICIIFWPFASFFCYFFMYDIANKHRFWGIKNWDAIAC